jgi:hypothetical protein
MFYDYKVWSAAVAVCLTILAYIPYLRGIYSGTTKPHLFSWIIWSLTTLIAAIIQVVKGGAAGAWPTLLAAGACIWIVYLSVSRGSKDIRRIDWYFLFASLGALPLWIITKDPTWSALLVTGVEIVAIFPTLRKSWSRPEQEVAFTWGIGVVRFLLSIIALETYSIATVAYPAGMIFMSGLTFSVLIIRRQAGW